MATYRFEQFNVDIIDPTIEKHGVFGFRFTNNSSGNFEGTVNLHNSGGKIYNIPLSSPREEAPNVLDDSLSDEDRATLIDGWVLTKLSKNIID